MLSTTDPKRSVIRKVEFTAAYDLKQRMMGGFLYRCKPRAAAAADHIADRFAQASDNLAFLVEEHDVSRRLARYERLDRDLSDLFNDSVADRSSFYRHTGREYIFAARYSY